ncbi:hypothetical protein BJY54_002435 [Streptomyces nodosus]|uniref:Uncharacterized protein n=1 Tax=Streptomyces nodosus TaxID=40318 RepID=A0A0B5DAX9_9ACTN|nr:hypothetical protein SNOD_12340 [Streptomyces nodosus]MBB4791823.1 hypothetical protein [Streptomyces nodosus]
MVEFEEFVPRGVDMPAGPHTPRGSHPSCQLPGGEPVFVGVSGLACAPRDARASIASGAGGRFALAGAKCERRLPARYGPAPEVPVEGRGGGIRVRRVRGPDRTEERR